MSYPLLGWLLPTDKPHRHSGLLQQKHIVPKSDGRNLFKFAITPCFRNVSPVTRLYRFSRGQWFRGAAISVWGDWVSRRIKAKAFMNRPSGYVRAALSFIFALAMVLQFFRPNLSLILWTPAGSAKSVKCSAISGCIQQIAQKENLICTVLISPPIAAIQ